MGNQQADIRLMQMFPWFGMLRTQKDEASKMAMAQYEVFRDAKNRLYYQVKNTWYEMYQLEEEIRIVEENLEILQTYEHLALIRFQSAGTGSGSGTTGSSSMQEESKSSSGSTMGGMGGGLNTGQPGLRQSTSMSSSSSMGASGSGMSDVLRVRMEIKELESNLAVLKDSRKPLQAEFNQLLNRSIDEPIAVADTLTDTALSVERLVLLDSITQNNPMLKMLDEEEGAYEIQQKMARQAGRPMMGAGVNYMPFSPRMEDGMAMGGNDMIMPMVSVTVPIYRKKYKAMYKESEFRQQAVQQRRVNTVRELSTQWATAFRDLDDATRRAALYRELTGLATQTQNLLMTGYSASGRDFEEVLRIQRQLLDYQLKLITAIVDQHTTVAMLEMLAAMELD